MFTGALSRWVVAMAAAVLAAPVALACEDPNNFGVALRKSPPLSVDAGEVVLELDFSNVVMGEDAPTIIKFDNDEMVFPHLFGMYTVNRVVSGHFGGAQAKISYGTSSCWMLGFKGANFVVGRPKADSRGVAYFDVHSQTYPEAVAEFTTGEKAAN